MSIEKSMENILNGSAKKSTASAVAVAKIIEAAEILAQAGYAKEAALTMSLLKDSGSDNTEASIEVYI